MSLYSGPLLRHRLRELPGYVANEGWPASVGWRVEGNGHALGPNSAVIKSGSAASTNVNGVAVVVGLVSDSKLNVGPTGNYNPSYNTLPSAKFQLTLVNPNDPDFAQDWSHCIAHLEKAQSTIASTEDRRYLILREGLLRSLRLSAPVFGKKDLAITEEIRTETWPVETQHAEALAGIVDSYSAQPLPVYRSNDEFVHPKDVTNALKGSLVEIHFTVKHYTIGRDTRHDVFSGIIEQIIILQGAQPALPNPYKQRLTKGPYRATRANIHAEQLKAVDTFFPTTNPYQSTQTLGASTSKTVVANIEPSTMSSLNNRSEDSQVVHEKTSNKDHADGHTIDSPMTQVSSTISSSSSNVSPETGIPTTTESIENITLATAPTLNSDLQNTLKNNDTLNVKRDGKRKNDDNNIDIGERAKRRSRKD